LALVNVIVIIIIIIIIIVIIIIVAVCAYAVTDVAAAWRARCCSTFYRKKNFLV